ncbi:FMN-binding protein [Clostridiales bacterium COT073_COT-073]|nr:FMN-binding protein [Clostridiales bacterium COT073_COT-073]
MRKHFFKHCCFALLVTALLCSSISIPSFAGEIKDHWSYATLKQWEQEGLLNKEIFRSFHPDAAITRAEFMTLINQLLNFTEESTAIAQYKDVEPNAWYYTDIAKALAAGYMNGTSANTMNPLGQLTNEQAYTILARLVKTNGAFDLTKVSDHHAISSWAKTYISQVLTAGYVTGHDGKINPAAVVNWSHIIPLLDRFKNNDRIFAFPGVYSAGSARNVTILTDGVTLKDMTITGNLILSPAAKTVQTVRTTIKGTILHKDIDEILETYVLTDGIYEGVAQGYGGTVRLQVTIQSGKISQIAVLSHSETPAYWQSATPILEKIIQTGTTDNIDSVSGATISSQAIFNAIADALSQAKGKTKVSGQSKAAQESNSSDDDNSGYSPTEPNKNDYSKLFLPDGEYIGSAIGYGGTITVTVTVTNGVIAKVDVNSHKETNSYYEKAFPILDKVVAKNSTNVDTISGATVTSKGLLSAIENALVKVIPKEKEEYADGTWYGQGRGHYPYDRNNVKKGATEVKVDIKDGKIADIKLLHFGDDDEYERTVGYLKINKYIIQKNSIKGLDEIFAKKTHPIYDEVSRATNSARGYVNAIEHALKRSMKYKKDQKPQRIRSIQLMDIGIPGIHYDETIDLSNCTVKVSYLDGTAKTLNFKDLADEEITCNYPVTFTIEPDDPNHYDNQKDFELTFTHAESLSKHSSGLTASRKIVDLLFSKAVFADKEGNQLELPLNDNDFLYTIELPDNSPLKLGQLDTTTVQIFYKTEDGSPEPKANLKAATMYAYEVPMLQVDMETPIIKGSDKIISQNKYNSLQFYFKKKNAFNKNDIAKLEIAENPVKLKYKVGESLDLSGLKLILIDSDYHRFILDDLSKWNDYEISTIPANDSELQNSGEQEVIIKHKDNGIKTSFTILVEEDNEALDLIKVYDESGQTLWAEIHYQGDNFITLTIDKQYRENALAGKWSVKFFNKAGMEIVANKINIAGNVAIVDINDQELFVNLEFN